MHRIPEPTQYPRYTCDFLCVAYIHILRGSNRACRCLFATVFANKALNPNTYTFETRTLFVSDFTSRLVCTAEELCSLTFTQQKQTYEFTCVCGGDHCSRAFSHELRGELLNYTSRRPTPNNSADFTNEFFTSSKYVNVTKTALYNVLTVRRLLNSNVTSRTVSAKPTTRAVKTLTSAEQYSDTRHVTELLPPRVEALKQDSGRTTVPSEDDEDEGEGSGSYEESRSQRRPVSAPAAPSSYLPTSENGAAYTHNGLAALPLILHILL